jgi:hypothetical protein
MLEIPSDAKTMAMLDERQLQDDLASARERVSTAANEEIAATQAMARASERRTRALAKVRELEAQLESSRVPTTIGGAVDDG